MLNNLLVPDDFTRNFADGINFFDVRELTNVCLKGPGMLLIVSLAIPFYI